MIICSAGGCAKSFKFLEPLLKKMGIQVINVPFLDKDLTASVPYSGECMIDGKIKIWIGVSCADGLKCDRCWNYSPLVGSFAEHPKLCRRCYDVIGFYQPATLAAVS